MKKYVPYITGFLLLFPLLILIYKSQVLKMSLVPQMVDDVWDFHLSIRPKGVVNSFSFPVPKSGQGVRVSDERFKKQNYTVFSDSNTADSIVMTWTSKTPIIRRVQYSARVDVKPIKYKVTKDTTDSYPKGLLQYLKIPKILPEDEEAVSLLENAILEKTESKTSAIRKIYYYIEEEVQRNTAIKTIHETLVTGKGSPLVKAKLFNLMARRQKVPARVVVMVRLPEVKDEAKAKIRFTFANEVFLNNRWIPIDTNRGHFAERPDSFLVLHHNYEEIEKMISRKNVTYKIIAERVRVNKFNRKEYRKEVAKSDSIFAKVSLYKLPLPLQAMFTTILLIPLGAIVLSLARNVIGIPTFGIFSPILLALFFKETSLGFGTIFFFIVVLIGIGQRYVLDKFYLLAVPRMSIILTLVIVFMIGYSFWSVDVSFISQKHLSFFPIVIVTTNIERLSIMIAEEGVFSTLKTLIGTLFISLLTYAMFFIHTLEMFMFTNPELLLTIIGILILLGKYKGYRLSEFIRFRDLVKQRQLKDEKRS